jgi:predicted aspartyl protease
MSKSLLLLCPYFPAALLLAISPLAYAQNGQNIAAENNPAEIAALVAPAMQEFVYDTTARMTVPVRINQSTEYSFIVDTGTERTVIANELAKILSLKTGERLRLATVSGPATVNSYFVDSLTTSTTRIDGLLAPGLDQQNLGAFGLLGLDSLQDKKIDIDLRAHTMTVSSSKSRNVTGRYDGEMIVVLARRKEGRLILSDAKVNGKNVDIVIDTGSQSSLGNQKLRNILERQNRKGGFLPVAMTSVTGKILEGDYTQIRSIEIGGIEIGDLPITFSDNYAMQTLGLAKRPAIFLGMDALQLFDRVIIDFAKKQVSFGLPKRSRMDTASKMANAESSPITQR